VLSDESGPSLHPVFTDYNNQGRLSRIMHGPEPDPENEDTRTTTMQYVDDADITAEDYAATAKGLLKSIEDPLGRTVTFHYDAAGRVTIQTLPDSREILYDYL
jgi:YD repeat-containing protein